MTRSSRSTTDPAPARKPSLFPVICVVLVDLIGFGIVLPLLPFYAKDLGAGAFQTGWLFSVYSIAQMAASPLWGRWSDRVGRRPVMLLSTFGASAAYLLFAVSHAYPLLFVSRLAAGLMGGNIAAAQAYVADVTAPESRAKGMGLIGAAFGIGFALGPAIAAVLILPMWASVLSPSFPWLAGALRDRPYLLPGLFAAAMSASSFLYVLFRLPESRRPDVPNHGPTAPTGSAAIWSVDFWRQFTRRGAAGQTLPMLWAASGILAFAQSSLYGAFPLFCQARYGLTAREISLLYILMGGIAVVVQGGAIRMLVKRHAETTLFFTGAVLLTAALLAMPLMPGYGAFAAMIGLMTLGASLSGPTLSSLVSQAAGTGATGEALGRAQGMAGLGRAVGPAWGGWLYDRWMPLPFIATGVFSAQAVVMGIRMLRNKRSV